jgi:hypothetical protein
MASIGVFLVSAVHESTSEQRGNNKPEEEAMCALRHAEYLAVQRERYTAWHSIDD